MIKGNLSDANMVEKSRPLMLLSQIVQSGGDGQAGDGRVSFSLGEFRVLDTYLSKINARDPEHRTVRFSKKEYEELMGLKQMRPEQIDKLTNNLFDTKIRFQIKNAAGEVVSYDKIHLFDKCRVWRDNDEQWWVDMKCSEDAQQLFFSVNEIGYFRYYLSNIISLTSLYSYRLYMYLLINGVRGEWSVGFDELREVLDCNAKRYEEIKFFNAEVLKRAVAEVDEKTDMAVECRTEKTGRKVTGFRFKCRRVGRQVGEPDQQKAIEMTDADEQSELFASMLPDELTREQTELLGNMAIERVGIFSGDVWDVRLRAADYLKEKVALMQAQPEPVKSKFGWLRKAVTEDWK